MNELADIIFKAMIEARIKAVGKFMNGKDKKYLGVNPTHVMATVLLNLIHDGIAFLAHQFSLSKLESLENQLEILNILHRDAVAHLEDEIKKEKQKQRENK